MPIYCGEVISISIYQIDLFGIELIVTCSRVRSNCNYKDARLSLLDLRSIHCTRQVG